MQAYNREEKPDSIDALFEAGRLESIQRHYDQTTKAPDRHKIDKCIAVLIKKMGAEKACGEIRNVHRLARRLKALKIFKNHGFDPEMLIQPVDLPWGYSGKILLVIVSFGSGGESICLRSGDDWHREILKNTAEEMADLGFENISVTPAGGASVRFSDHGEMTIYGTSDEYGACDKRMAAKLIADLFPDQSIRMED